MNRICFRLTLSLALLGAVACGDNQPSTPDGGVDPDGQQPDGPTPDGPDPDGPTPDGGGGSGLQAAQDAADGAVEIDVTGVLVTYIKPPVGADPGGFFVQEAQAGPALFVSIDPATLTPSPAIGDDISFHISSVATLTGLRHANAIDTVVINAGGIDPVTFRQNISAADDVVTALDSYESEFVEVTATIAEDFAFAGGGHDAARIETAGITGNNDYRLRVPSTVLAQLTDGGITTGCTIRIANGIMWRFNQVAQVSVWDVADVDLASTLCPPPVVEGAVSLGSTEVRVDFDRAIDPASLIDVPNQFTFDNGLTAVSAVASGASVTVTTSLQTGGDTYNVTVADTVADVFGGGVSALANTATFSGFLVPAVVRINEVSANIGSSCDLVELRVVSAGSMAGFLLRERDTQDLVTFPAGFNVSANDLIVVHFNDNATCNPGGSPAAELNAPNENPAATFSANFDTAFDFYSADSGMTNTDNVLTLFDAAGGIADAVLVSDDTSGTAAAASETAAEVVRAADAWRLPDGTLPGANFYVDDDFNANAAQDLNAAPTGSIQRIDNNDTDTRNDWSAPVGGANPAPTFGLLNIGQ